MKIAIIQNKWKEDARDNLEHVLSMTLETCEKHKPDFICLPEFFMGPPWYIQGQEHLKGITDDIIPGNVTNLFSAIAKKYNTYIICGTFVERINDLYYNSSVLLSNKGEIIGKSRKVHTFAAESIKCQAGREFRVFQTDFGKVGIAVCSDLWILECPRILSLKGAKIIFVPGGSLKQNIKANIAVVKATAHLNNVIVVYTSSLGQVIGSRNGKKSVIDFYGHSMIVDPTNVLAETADQEAVRIAIIDDMFFKDLQDKNNELISSKYAHLRMPELYEEITTPYINMNRDLNEEFKEGLN